ncbi:HepT-like ribonuclease domain-containing protein [Cellulosimicrobium sp. Marseille-Q8652]
MTGAEMPLAGDRDADKSMRTLVDLSRFGASARRIVGRGREAFFHPEDDILRRAGRSVIVDVSAAADRFPAAFVAAHPDVPWREIRATRNRIAHQYDGVSDEIVWDTLRLHLPDLLKTLGVAS